MSHSSHDLHGWANQWTWLVHLWLMSDKQAYADAHSIVRQVVVWPPFGQDHAARMRKYVEQELIGDVLSEASLVSDIVYHALAEVDWGEIVEVFSEEAKEGVVNSDAHSGVRRHDQQTVGWMDDSLRVPGGEPARGYGERGQESPRPRAGLRYRWRGSRGRMSVPIRGPLESRMASGSSGCRSAPAATLRPTG